MTLHARLAGWRHLHVALLSLALAATGIASTSSTPPIGALGVRIAGGTIAAPFTTDFAVPLLDAPAATGLHRGRLTSVTSTSFGLSGAGWTANALAQTAFPYVVRVVNGSAEGATFSITGNTAETLTLSGRDPVALGVAVGDVIQLIPVDTLNSLFGSTTFLGGTSPSNADIITLSSSAQLSYYYNTTLGRWVRTTGPTTDRGSIPIPPDSVVSVTRRGPAFTLTFAGQVPVARVNYPVANAGSTYTHAGFPTDVTLGTLALQQRLTGWVSAASAASADFLGVPSGGIWLYYFHNGSYWQRTTGPATNRDAIVIGAGTPIQIFRRGTANGTTPLVRPVPFSL